MNPPTPSPEHFCEHCRKKGCYGQCLAQTPPRKTTPSPEQEKCSHQYVGDAYGSNGICIKCGWNVHTQTYNTIAQSRPTPSPDELLPCPFCGGEAEFIKTIYKNVGYVLCKICKSGKTALMKKDVAVKVWNTRPANKQISTSPDEVELEKIIHLNTFAHRHETGHFGINYIKDCHYCNDRPWLTSIAQAILSAGWTRRRLDEKEIIKLIDGLKELETCAIVNESKIIAKAIIREFNGTEGKR